MLTKEQLYDQNTMPEWNDISLELYKKFTLDCLLPKTFRYYLENEQIINVQFKKWATPAMRKRLNDNKDRIRMFSCIYQVLKNGAVFYVENGKLSDTDIKIDYIKSKSISGKGVHLGMRFEENVYVPLTLLMTGL